MLTTRRTTGALVFATMACLLAGHGGMPIGAQDTPNRREFTITAKDFQFSPARVEAAQDDLLSLTVQSQDLAYSFTIDEYRISRRVPAGGETTVQFRADRAGTFRFYSNLTNDPRHRDMRGTLVVQAR